MQKRDTSVVGIKQVVLLTGAAVVLLGCGSGSGQCGGNVACGGNLVGTWNIEDLCVESATSTMTGSTCSGIGVSTSGLRESGTITFNADLTYTSNATISGSLSETVPSSCLTTGGVTVSCAQLNAGFQPASDGGLAGSCVSGGGGSCVCSFQFPSQTSMESGTYSISGSTVTNTPTAGTASSSSYCVQGSTLTLASMPMSMPGASQGSAELVLTRQ
jgi:hypothetical protein